MKNLLSLGMVALTLVLVTLQGVYAEGAWEMKVCADPDDYPISDQQRPGFENRISEILADELHAKLSYVWTPINDTAVINHLRPGDCDMMMGVSEGASGLLNTVPYYRAPYVFVYRKDAPYEIQSLNDEALTRLRITTFPDSLLHRALIESGLGKNVVLPDLAALASTTKRTATLIQAVLNGDADVAVVYGPEASYVVAQHPDILQLVPVAPEIVPPLLQMFRIETIGVRPNDEALRDRLNIALAKRWDDIQAVFQKYDVPLLSVPTPLAPEAGQAKALRIGVVLPTPTGNPAPTDVVGEAARAGAVVAESLVGRGAMSSAPLPDVLLASSPSADAAVRAAERMVTTDGITALVGGLGEGQAKALSKVAEERGVLFFNIGAPDQTLREESCSRNTFHVAASAAMYLDALIGWFSQADDHRWFFVYPKSDDGRELYRNAVQAMTEGDDGAVEAGSAEVTPGQLIYNDALDKIRQAAPDVVLLLLEPSAQEFFLSQYGSSGLKMPITGFPFPIMQTRDFLFRLEQVTASTGAGYRVALWDTTLEADGAGDLNDQFMSRSGQPMDPTAWATYAAIKVLFDAVSSTGTQAMPALVDFLENPQTAFDVYKGKGTSFRSWDHQLRQPLYLIQINPKAKWGVSPIAKAKFAKVVGELPHLHAPKLPAAERWDRLGKGPNETSCTF